MGGRKKLKFQINIFSRKMVQKDQQGDWRSGRKYELRNIYNLRICGKAWNAGRFIGFYRWCSVGYIFTKI